MGRHIQDSRAAGIEGKDLLPAHRPAIQGMQAIAEREAAAHAPRQFILELKDPGALVHPATFAGGGAIHGKRLEGLVGR
jgi:hypothetical protein